MTKLEEIRRSKGLSRKQLSELSGVPLRTIEAYEQERKDLKKMSLETYFKLSKALDYEFMKMD